MNSECEKTYELGCALGDQGKYVDSIRYFTEVIQKCPDLSRAYSSRAYCKYKINDISGALEDYTNAIELDPISDIAYYSRLTIRNEIGDFEGAILDCDKLIEIDPNDAQAYYSRGSAALNLGDYAQAFEDNNRSIELDPDFPNSYVNRAICRISLNDYLAAIDDCNAAIQLNPNIHEAFNNRAIAKGELEYYLDAIDDCDISMQIMPVEFNADALLNRAFFKMKLCNFWGAFEDYSALIDKFPKDPDIYLNRSAANLYLGRENEAIADACRSIELNPLDHSGFERLGEILSNLTRAMESSICAYRIALELDKENINLPVRIAQSYLDWKSKSNNSHPIIDFLCNYSPNCESRFIGAEQFNDRIKIAKSFFAKSFQSLLPILRTDVTEYSEQIELFLFVGNLDFIAEPLINRSLFFADARQFPDKTTDCPILHPINQAKDIIQLTYDNIRIRCLCKLSDKNGIEDCHNMWDIYANGHSGVAFKLIIKKAWLIEKDIYLSPISYMQHDHIELVGDSPEQVIQDGLFVKNITYSHEHEWRMIKFGEFNSLEGVTVPFAMNNKQDGIIIESIYLGVNISSETKRKLLDMAASENIGIWEMILGENGTLGSIKIISSDV